MQISLTDVLNEMDMDPNRGDWWVGTIGKHMYVLPIGDIAEHISGPCPCKPTRKLCAKDGKPVLVVTHNAFDGRE